MKKKSTNQNSGLWTASYGEIGATLKALQDHGVTLEHLARLRAEPNYAERVAEYMLHGGVKTSTHHKLAHTIMGKNFFGIEDWVALLFKTSSQKQFRGVPDFPWSEEILTSTCPLCVNIVKDCHFAFLGFDRINGEPLTILKLQELHPAAGRPRFSSYYSQHDSHYSGKKFITETAMDFRWYLLHMDIVPGSENKTFEEQEAMLPAEYEVPFLVTEIAKDLFAFQETRAYAISARYKRCADIYLGCRVIARYCDASDLDFLDIFSDSFRRDNIYVAASRKPGI